MKDTIYLLIIIFILGYFLSANNNYQIINTQSGVFLLDTKSGLSWKQVKGNDNTYLYWQEMDFFGTLDNNVCKGKEKEHKKLQKKIKSKDPLGLF